jgi:hypothetical protein
VMKCLEDTESWKFHGLQEQVHRRKFLRCD